MNKRHRKTLMAIALVLAVSAASLLAACGGEETTSDDGAEVFKIGYSADLTGGFASYDVPIRDGAQTAVDEINEAGGINGVKLEMIVKDNKNDKVLAVQTTQELIDEGIQYLVGTTSDHVVACNRLAQESEISSSTGDGTAPNLVGDIGEYAFQYIMSDNIQGAALAEYSYNEMGYRNAFLLRCADIPYTANLPVYFQDAFEKLGGKAVGLAEYKYEAGDFAAQVTKIQNANPAPDVIFTPMFLPDTPVFLKQLRAAGVTIPVISTDGNDTPDILSAGAKALNGLKFTTFAYPSEGTSLASFYDTYKA
ncbi:MAG TPA: ABC transporter substrate-binding protein, partial [Thermoleophilia bacterium]|nr:ABC transporter substrate-binding protein [Thermoleophilia bacterium]